ncbi:MAG: nidogen-like domain-containing protein [Acidihalobacter sp.]|uniref:nidogen-like domain-containing protein n=1 Tax=Acidihalobacter sp. TaxID=1872108 RepID=UPI00307E3703
MTYPNNKLRTVLLAGTVGLACVATQAWANPINTDSAFTANTLARNDDGSTSPVSLGFTANFFGTTYVQTYVNNNGNVTFGSPLSTYTPFGLTTNLGAPIIAPFFADVDTSSAGSPVTYGTGTVNGRSAFGVNWINVDYYNSSPNHTKRDSFQMLLVDRADTGLGNFDILFNYGQIQWETGDASGGSGGLGGSCAVAGYSNGTGDAGTYYQLPGSGACGAFLDGGPNALITATNDGTPGQQLFQVRNGAVINPGPDVPEPSELSIFAVGLIGLAGLAIRRRRSTKL